MHIPLRSGKLALALLFASILTLLAPPMSHGDLIEQWQNVGPNGKSIALSPNFDMDRTIFSGSESDGILKSTDGGTNWSPANNGLHNLTVWAIGLSPRYTVDLTLFAGTDGGVFRSSDQGASWTPAQNGIGPQPIHSLAVSPDYQNDQTLFAGTWGGGLYKSSDGGMTWYPSGAGISDQYIPSLAFSPSYAADRTIYAGTLYTGVFKSIDGGATWNTVGITSTHTIHAIVVSPGYTADRTVYIGIGGGGGIMKSTDAGVTWQPVDNGLSNLNVLSLAISPGYADDPTPPGYPGDRTLFTGTFGGGIFRSIDGGSSWGVLNNGITSLNVGSLAISPAYRSDRTIYAGTDASLFRLASSTLAPAVSVSPSGMTFGNQEINSASMAQEITIINTGAAPLAVNSISVSDATPPQYTITSYGSCGFAPYLASGAGCIVSVGFAPTSEGEKLATLMISSDDPSTPIKAVPLSGVGTYVPPPAVVSRQPANGSTVPPSTTIQATFNEPMDATSITPATFSLTTIAGVGIRMIAAGGSHSVALKNDGTVSAWGDNSRGQCSPPQDLLNVVAVAAGDTHTLALKIDGTVVAWGNDDYGQSSVPVGLSGVTAVAAGGAHSLALKNDGTVVAWGSNQFTQATVPEGLAGVTAIAAGGTHSVALKNDGTVVAWGHSISGQATVPPGLSGVTAIAAGGEHTLALISNGTVVGWGYNYYGQTSIPEGLGGVTAIAAGGLHSLALKTDGTVVAWGYNILDQALVPTGLSGVKGISAGYVHSLALKNDSMPVGWGYNGNGQTSIPSALASPGASVSGSVSYDPASQTATFTPSLQLVNNTNYLASINGFRSLGGVSLAVPVSWSFTVQGPPLALSPLSYSFGTVPVFSSTSSVLILSNSGQEMLSLNSITIAGVDSSQFMVSPGTCGNLTPVLAPGGSCQLQISFVPTTVGVKDATIQVSAGSPPSELSAPLTGTGIEAADYPLNLVFDGTGLGAVKIATTITETSCSGSCIKTFTGGTVVTLSPVMSGMFAGWSGCDTLDLDTCSVSVDAARSVTAHFQTESLAYSPAIAAGMANTVIRKNDGSVWRWGGLFNGTGGVAQHIDDFDGSQAISTGTEHSAAITAARHVRMWGGNSRGQWGVGITGPGNEISGLSDVTAVAAGHWFTTAVTADGRVWSWGDNSDGCLGDGTTALRSDLVQVSGISGVIAIAASHSVVALTNDGSVWSWGRNEYGQLGDGTTSQRSLPAQISGLSDIIAVSSSNSHSIALRSNGTVWGWGSNYGPLPWQVQGLTDVVKIAAGGDSSLALKSDGTVWQWSGTNTPAPVAGLADIVAIAASNHSVALRNNGSIWSWGPNYSGELGDGTTNYSAIPVKATAEAYSASPLSIRVVGDGTVYSPEISCFGAGTCTKWLASGSTVVLVASPGSSQVIAGWSGCGSVAGNSCMVTVSGARYVTATFSPNVSYSLHVDKIGSGSGVVASIAPDTGINLQTAQSGSAWFGAGTPVTLTATPDNGFIFSGWRGACSGTGICTISMSQDTSVSAVFTTTATGNPGPVKMGSAYFTLMQDAYSSLMDGSSVVMYANALSVSEHLVFDRNITITLKGGYDSNFGQVSGQTFLKGSLTISSGSVIMENIVIQ